jgi:ubiquinone/menaquinone biosynthesis C-methylase UbiE
MDMMGDPSSTQKDAWSSGLAADNYFKRNQSTLDADQPTERATRLYASYIEEGDRVLEIGTANGRFLEQLRRLSRCEAYGIDPSPLAIQNGCSRYPRLHLRVGTADKIEYPDGFFNVVIFGFCLYLVDRKDLMGVVAESDRVLAGGGRLMITDFDPPQVCRRPFKHQEGVWSYKMQYPKLWLANPVYVFAEKVAFSHTHPTFHKESQERVASWVLAKQNETAYPEIL